MAGSFQDRRESNQQFILNELQKGNERAFNFIFKEYHKSLSQFSYSFIKDQDKAESLVQEVPWMYYRKIQILSKIRVGNFLLFLVTKIQWI